MLAFSAINGTHAEASAGLNKHWQPLGVAKETFFMA
jgi:hypothetical protein